MIIRTREGTKIPVELSISKVNIDDKVNFMCIIRDISNREKRERELRMQKEFLQETQKTANVGGFETDFSTNTLKLSNSNKDMLRNYIHERMTNRGLTSSRA